MTSEPLEKEFFKGATIFRKGDPNNNQMYIIKKGKIKIYSKVNNEEVEFDLLGPGEIFGELSIFDAQPRSATAEVIEDTKLIIINKHMIEEQIAKLPNWFNKFIRIITCRLRDADNLITQLIMEKKIDKKPKTKISKN